MNSSQIWMQFEQAVSGADLNERPKDGRKGAYPGNE